MRVNFAILYLTAFMKNGKARIRVSYCSSDRPIEMDDSLVVDISVSNKKRRKAPLAKSLSSFHYHQGDIRPS